MAPIDENITSAAVNPVVGNIISAAGSLLGVIVGFLLQEIKQRLNIRSKKKEDSIRARNIANMFLLREIQKNHETLTKNHGDWSYLSAVLEQLKYVNISRGIYHISEWDRYKYDIAQLDLNLAKKISKLYEKYEIINDFEGKVNQKLKEIFSNYKDIYEDVIKALQSNK